MMLLSALFKSFADLFSGDMRKFFWRSLGLTIVILIAMVVVMSTALSFAVASFPSLDAYPWISTLVGILSGFGLSILAIFMLPSVSMLVSSFFLEDVARVIEERNFKNGLNVKTATIGSAMAEAARLFALSLGLNVVALFFVFVPVVNVLIFLLVNAILLGREYFWLVSSRHVTPMEFSRLHRQHRVLVAIAGATISLMLFVPIVNLVMPLFATILMVHLHHALSTSR